MVEPERWWREGVFYQVYPRSFADSDADGIGDLRGLIDRLDHLEWLGVDGIWLSPIHPSPNEDWGYDVSDYVGVHPDLGTLEDVDELVVEAGRRGIRVLLDLVPNHTSIRHPWFRERPELYVWTDEPPNNWRSVFDRGPSWTLDGETGRYYLHTFATGQPDLDWRNPEVHAEFQRIIRFWLDRGVAGFRLDVVNVLYKDPELRDDPPAGPEDPPLLHELGMRRVNSMNQPEIHDLLREWRRLCEEYEPPRILVGEVYAVQVPHWASYYGNGDQLHLSFNFQLMYNRFEAGKLSVVVAEVERELPAGAWPCWAGSPRRRAAREPVGARRRAARPLRPPDPARPPRNALPLLRRRARLARWGGSARAAARPRGAGAGCGAHADALERGRRVAEPVAPARRHLAERRRSARRPGLDAALHARADRRAASAARSAHGLVPRARIAAGRLGVAARRDLHRRRQPRRGGSADRDQGFGSSSRPIGQVRVSRSKIGSAPATASSSASTK